MTFPQIDPIIFSIGPLAVRWYGMMYLLGFVGAYFMMVHVARMRNWSISKDHVSDLLFYGVLGVVLGDASAIRFFTISPITVSTHLKSFISGKGG